MKPARRTSRKAFPRAATGAIMVMLVLAMSVASAGLILAGSDLATQARARAQARSIEALAHARSALLGYAISYAELHPGQVHGYLPCPDTANTGSTTIGACHARDRGALARFPYRTLGLSDLRDGWGDCLWYAVSGSVKNNPKPLALNWDSPGQFEIVDSAGRSVVPAAAGVIAVLFAPGPPHPAQQRPSAGMQRCPGSTMAANDRAAFLDAPYPANIDGTQTFIQGQPGSADNNDLLAWLTVDDIFTALRRRSDFPVFINGILDRAGQAFASWSADPAALNAHATRIIGNRASGPMPDAAILGLAPPFAEIHDNWRDQLSFLACTDATTCLEAELTDSAHHPVLPAVEGCRALLLFGGERIRSGGTHQSRTTAAERADPAQYLEGANPSNLATGSGRFTGHRRFSVPHPSEPATADILICLA